MAWWVFRRGIEGNFLMTLLAEYALTPDVFDSTCYANDEVGNIRLQHLKEVLLSEGLVRDLRDGLWFALFADDGRSWHHRGRELLKKLVQQRRLYPCPPALPDNPNTDSEWCREALASHTYAPLAGIISTRGVADNFREEQLVTSIDRLTNAPWWANRSPSVRLIRNLESYNDNLRLVLQYANSIMFIDRNLDPTKPHYRDFLQLLLTLAGRHPAPLIEIHRVCYIGSGPQRQIMSNDHWESVFKGAWARDLISASLSVEVFIWDDFHDRYIVSDLIGISLPNGFDTTTNPQSLTTWTRLGRKDRDDIQKEFDRASNRHKIRHNFKVP